MSTVSNSGNQQTNVDSKKADTNKTVDKTEQKKFDEKVNKTDVASTEKGKQSDDAAKGVAESTAAQVKGDKKPESGTSKNDKKPESGTDTSDKKPESGTGTNDKKPESGTGTNDKKPESGTGTNDKKPDSGTGTNDKKPDSGTGTNDKKPESGTGTNDKKPDSGTGAKGSGATGSSSGEQKPDLKNFSTPDISAANTRARSSIRSPNFNDVPGFGNPGKGKGGNPARNEFFGNPKKPKPTGAFASLPTDPKSPVFQVIKPKKDASFAEVMRIKEKSLNNASSVLDRAEKAIQKNKPSLAPWNDNAKQLDKALDGAYNALIDQKNALTKKQIGMNTDKIDRLQNKVRKQASELEVRLRFLGNKGALDPSVFNKIKNATGNLAPGAASGGNSKPNQGGKGDSVGAIINGQGGREKDIGGTVRDGRSATGSFAKLPFSVNSNDFKPVPVRDKASFEQVMRTKERALTTTRDILRNINKGIKSDRGSLFGRQTENSRRMDEAIKGAHDLLFGQLGELSTKQRNMNTHKVDKLQDEVRNEARNLRKQIPLLGRSRLVPELDNIIKRTGQLAPGSAPVVIKGSGNYNSIGKYTVNTALSETLSAARALRVAFPITATGATAEQNIYIKTQEFAGKLADYNESMSTLMQVVGTKKLSPAGVERFEHILREKDQAVRFMVQTAVGATMNFSTQIRKDIESLIPPRNGLVDALALVSQLSTFGAGAITFVSGSIKAISQGAKSLANVLPALKDGYAATQHTINTTHKYSTTLSKYGIDTEANVADLGNAFGMSRDGINQMIGQGGINHAVLKKFAQHHGIDKKYVNQEATTARGMEEMGKRIMQEVRAGELVNEIAAKGTVKYKNYDPSGLNEPGLPIGHFATDIGKEYQEEFRKIGWSTYHKSEGTRLFYKDFKQKTGLQEDVNQGPFFVRNDGGSGFTRTVGESNTNGGKGFTGNYWGLYNDQKYGKGAESRIDWIQSIDRNFAKIWRTSLQWVNELLGAPQR